MIGKNQRLQFIIHEDTTALLLLLVAANGRQ
jgi:hypothetical protein